ncbi:protein croquemort isoform X1 [Musca domestica]|uniref:Protein croquemort isoform X1 n=2 Tax=Musca domestica TaxID=7370 RepID=A0ABM3UV46_MUSDO|nr:protein croquemort isoform X1 [Musca domestica]
MCCNCCSVRQQKIWVFSIGTILTVLGAILIPMWPTWSEDIIKSILPLSPGSVIYNKWVVTPLPIYMSFYMYNWTNPEEVNNTRIKPNFKEVGPYTFKNVKVKEDLKWNNEDHTVTFFSTNTWTFVPEKSSGGLDDVIRMPHFPTAAAARITRKWHKIIRKVVNFGLQREGGAMTMTHTALEWLFDGFIDNLLDFVYRLHSPLFPLVSNRFGWFYDRNNSKEAEGSYTIYTGKGNLKDMGESKMWNGSDHTKFWEGECGRVNGSLGDLWAPGKSWDDPTSIFLYDAGRFLNIFPIRNETYRGIDVRRYEATNRTLDNGQIVEDTKCFCVKRNECPENGVLDFSPKAFRAPVYMSHPHFYMASERYRENITGLEPVPEHATYVVLEPKWGIPMKVKGQMMASILYEKDNQMEILKDLGHNFYAPLLRISLDAEINDEMLDLVKLLLNVPSIGVYIGAAFLTIGVVMLVVGIYITKTHKWRGDSYPGESTESPAIETDNKETQSGDTENTNETPPGSENIQTLTRVTEISEESSSPAETVREDPPEETPKTEKDTTVDTISEKDKTNESKKTD